MRIKELPTTHAYDLDVCQMILFCTDSATAPDVMNGELWP